jgi:hypothetical protein
VRRDQGRPQPLALEHARIVEVDQLRVIGEVERDSSQASRVDVEEAFRERFTSELSEDLGHGSRGVNAGIQTAVQRGVVMPAAPLEYAWNV